MSIGVESQCDQKITHNENIIGQTVTHVAIDPCAIGRVTN